MCQHSAFFIIQLSHVYMTTGKTIALTRRTFVDKLMSLLLNILSRLVITFLPRSKCLLISWLQSPSAVILEPQNIYFFIDYAKAFDCVDHNKLWKILKEMGIPDHLTCLLRNPHADQEAAVRTGHGTIDRFQIRKGVHQGCILSPCLFNLSAEYIMKNAGIKTARRNINNLRYTDDTTLVAESEEELKSLLMKEESEKVGLKLHIQKTKIMAMVPSHHGKQMEKQWKQ